MLVQMGKGEKGDCIGPHRESWRTDHIEPEIEWQIPGFHFIIAHKGDTYRYE